jgi:two-component system, cell cycle sensor histidine kinase and response regulator CckA
MKVSIRWVLILGSLAMIWVTQVITISTSYVSSQRVLLSHAQDIMRNIADLAMEQAGSHLIHAESAAHLTKRLLTSNVVGRTQDRMTDLERYFHDQLAVYPQFAGIYLGEPNGNFFDVRRDATHGADGIRTKISVHANGGKETHLVWRDNTNRIVDRQIVYDDAYDPRKRPWYLKATEEKRIVWTDPYIFFTSQKPGITIAGPTYTPDGLLKGIVGVDIEIDELSLFISKLRIGKNGRAFMLNRNGDVVAFPDLSKLKYKDPVEGQAYRLAKINELDDVLSRKAFAAMDLDFDQNQRFTLEQARFGKFDHAGQTYHAMFTPFLEHQWPWVIGVYIPEDDYIGAIKENRRANIIVTLICSAGATIFGLWLAGGIIRPVAGMAEEAQAIRKKDFQHEVPTDSIYREIQATADSLAELKAALVRSKEKYRSIYDNIQDIYYESDMSGTLLEISPSIEKQTHYTREELLGESVYRLYQDPSQRDALLQVFYDHGQVSDYEVTIRDKDDTLLFCSINARLLRMADGTPERMVGSLRIINDRKQAEQELETYRRELETLVEDRTADLQAVNQKLLQEIEQRKYTEEALRKSEGRYRTVLEDIEEGYFECDLEGHLSFFNDPLCRILGFNRAELLGMDGRHFMSEASAQKITEEFRKITYEGDAVKVTELEVFRRDQAHRTMEISASLIFNRHGKPSGHRGLVRDVTERLQAEREHRRMELKFQQVQRLKGLGTLAGGVAHDFNNLLMGIQGNVSVLLLDCPPESELYENLQSIQQCVESGAKLTQQLLGFARGGKYVVEPTDLNSIVRSTSQLFGRTRKEIVIFENYEDEIWAVNVDKKQIEQVLLNIYINAWQAMQEDGGELYLRTENVLLDSQRGKLFHTVPGKYVKISIKDTGGGMDEATMQRIFEPFFTTKEIGTGTGLGLASAFGIIKSHNGYIDVQSRLGHGATFVIYLPATEEEVREQEEKVVELVPGTETILLVDDEHAILDACSAMLEKLGYDVMVARGGKEAVDVYRKHQSEIDLVILDIIMPDLSGGEVFDRLLDMNPEVRVLLSSGYSIEDQAAAILDRGCDGFIQKPFQLDQLHRNIREIMAT